MTSRFRKAVGALRYRHALALLVFAPAACGTSGSWEGLKPGDEIRITVRRALIS
ncbi:MAG TPA: hypothetical protein VKY73_10805 [Polyangiaceae bacterium]|nr:hypothetical protein [Polyangiaceae bacterium]